MTHHVETDILAPRANIVAADDVEIVHRFASQADFFKQLT